MIEVSIVIVNWNGKKFLKNCLDSLQKLTYNSVEIIVVDNNSIDGSGEFVKKYYTKVRLIENKKNYGYAGGASIGCKHARGSYVLFLNNDTIVTSGFIEPLLDDFRIDPTIGCVESQMRLMKDKSTLDVVGDFISFTGFLYHYGYRKKTNVEKYNRQKIIFSAKGACAIFPRSLLQEIGFFDEDFFTFFEDTDLCFRVWLSGHKVIYEPKSVIYHVGAGDTSSSNEYKHERRIYLTLRNMNCSYIKNFGTRNLLTIYPVFLITQVCFIIYSLLKLRFGVIMVIFRAYWWNILNLSKTLEKRRFIQSKIRKVSDKDINAYIKMSPRWSYYYYNLFRTIQEYND